MATTHLEPPKIFDTIVPGPRKNCVHRSGAAGRHESAGPPPAPAAAASCSSSLFRRIGRGGGCRRSRAAAAARIRVVSGSRAAAAGDAARRSALCDRAPARADAPRRHLCLPGSLCAGRLRAALLLASRAARRTPQELTPCLRVCVRLLDTLLPCKPYYCLSFPARFEFFSSSKHKRLCSLPPSLTSPHLAR